jgi:small subunit ribosomal protein S10
MYTISIHLKCFDLNFLAKTEKVLFSLFDFFNKNQLKHQFNPGKSKKITVLRSPHIDKKSREQFQLHNYKRTHILRSSDKYSVLLILEILKQIKLLGVELELQLEYLTF